MEQIKIEKRARVELGEIKGYAIMLVGCGGTGSFMALHIARLAYHLLDRKGMTGKVGFVDYDSVERKNLGRQNFCPAEVGMPKAEALARRYSLAFGLNIEFAIQSFNDQTQEAFFREATSEFGPRILKIVIGCVDGASGRTAIHEAHKNSSVWWLDCGNHRDSGQVLLGNSSVQKPMVLMGMCNEIPLPSIQHPELLEVQEEAEHPLSCADLAVMEQQSLMVNTAMSTWAASYLSRLLVSRDLDVYATYVDLVSGSARSLGIVR